jgi:glycosyltransferase involved in cell wall biosynthesis
MLLSVIIPVYNVAGTLQRCIDSVLAQRMDGDVDGMEIILVDDGSTDNSSVLCDKYSSKENVHVIHQDNAGLSEARNAGLRIAKGDYVTFVDSDDYLEPNTYNQLLPLCIKGQCDILEYSFYRQLYKDKSAKILSDRLYTDPISYWLDGQAYTHSYAWNKIYRRSLFDKVQFPKGKKFEDVPTLWQLLQKAKRIRTTSLCFYHYTYNANGITQRARGKSYRDLLQAHLPIINATRLRAHDGFGEYYRHVLNIQLQTYIYTGNRKDIQLPVLPYNSSIKLKLMHLLGLPMLCKVLRAYHLIFNI